MAHFAKLDSNNMVLSVIVVSNETATDEANGLTFLSEWSGGETNWKQCSYNGNIRKNFPGIGWHFDPELDAFVAPKPFDSWVFDPTLAIWSAPVPKPVDGKSYAWVEKTLSWRLNVPKTLNEN